MRMIGTKTSSGLELNIIFKNSAQKGERAKNTIVKTDW